MSSVEYWPRQHYGLCHQRYSHTDKDWQVLTNTEKYREIQSNIVKYWQILSNTNKYWQILSNIYVIRGILISNILVAPPPCLILIQFAHIFFADEHQENLKSINNGAECVLLGGNSWALLGFLALTLVCHKPAGLWWVLKAPLAFLSTNLKLDAEGECATESEKAWFSFDTCFLSKTLTEHLVFIVRLICPTSLWQRASSLPAWKKGESGCSVKNDLESGRRGLAVLRYSLYDATARYILWPFLVV